MKSLLNMGEWNRRDQFHFFNQFEEPFFGVCVTVNCTRAYALAKEKGVSFFLYYLHKCLKAANLIEPFRYRIDENNQVALYDAVHASSTINRPDGSFGFGYMDYHPEFDQFQTSAKKEIEKVQQSTGLIPSVSGENVIHCSSIPWIRFSSLSHARGYSFKDSIPKIGFGKMTTEHEHQTMPFSVHVHHALMDGYHVGQFIDCFQDLLNADESL